MERKPDLGASNISEDTIAKPRVNTQDPLIDKMHQD